MRWRNETGCVVSSSRKRSAYAEYGASPFATDRAAFHARGHIRKLAPDGGLYMPAEIARRSPEELEEFRRLPFTEVCFRVVRPFAGPEIPEEVLWQMVSEAINFPVKLVSLSPALHILELFHGPTLAFKDFGARFMAAILIIIFGFLFVTVSSRLTGEIGSSSNPISGICSGRKELCPHLMVRSR